MLHIQDIRKNNDGYIASIKKRSLDATTLITDVITKDDQRKKLQQERDALLAQANQLTKDIGEFYKKGKLDKVDVLKKESVSIKDLSKNLQLKQKEVELEIQDILQIFLKRICLMPLFLH